MNEATAKLLRRLLDDGSVRLSAVSRSATTVINSLVETGALAQERVGGGCRVVVCDPQAVEGQLRAARPEWEGKNDVPPRAEAIRRLRNAKKATSDTPEFLLLRSCQPSCVWRNGNTEIDVAKLTRKTGIACLAVEPGDQWSTDAPLGMLENKEVFWHCDKLYRNTECGSFLYYSGNVPKRVLTWFADRPRTPHVFFYPDYDPVGLRNYLAMKAHCREPVEMILPPDFEELLKTCGKKELLTKNIGCLKSVLEQGDKMACQIVELMQKYGCGLEQEVLLALV